MNGRITKLSATNFTSIAQMELDLDSLNVLVGPNGAGKSNVLKAIRFLGDLHQRELGAVLHEYGGRERLLFRGATGDGSATKLGVTAEFSEHSSPSAPDEYELSLRWQEGFFDVARHETFTFKRMPGRGRRLSVSGSEFLVEFDEEERRGEERFSLKEDALMFSTLPRLPDWEGATQVEEVADLLGSFRTFDVSVDKARRDNRIDFTGGIGEVEAAFEPIDSDGGNLSRSLVSLMFNHREVYEELAEDLAVVVPGFDGFQIKWLGGGSNSVSVGIVERGYPGATPLADASFGTVRLIALLLLLHDPQPNPLTGIEEIDHGLHPHALDLVVNRLRIASTRGQFLVTTHSPTLVNRLDSSELVVCERDAETNESLIPAIGSDEVAAAEMAANGEWALGELWFAGTLGGGLS